MTPIDSPIRVGVIGTGWGGVAHLPAFAVVPEFHVVALSGRREERAKALAMQYGVAAVHADWRELIDRADVDLISIALPVEMHQDVLTYAVSRGKHVLCEKPVSRS